MRETVNALPRITKDLNRAKRAVVSSLDKLLADIESTGSTVVNIIDAMDRLLTTSSSLLVVPPSE
jgi:hypothetical protein